MNSGPPTLDGLWASFQNAAMKQCPECGAEYDDGFSFCRQDGRILVTKTEASARLCPNCANSVPADAGLCPYCKAELSEAPSPQWPTREAEAGPTKPARGWRITVMLPIIVLVLGIGMFAAGALLVAGNSERTESQLMLEEKIKQLQAQDQRIEVLQAELERARKDLSETSAEMANLRTRLEDSQRDFATSQTRIALLNREIERISASGAQLATKPVMQQEPKAASAQSPAATAEPRASTHSPALISRRPAEPGSYETLRATSVHAGPSETSQILSQISRGTRVAVVGSDGDWLEVRSRHGNPPGFIRRDDAMYVGAAN